LVVSEHVDALVVGPRGVERLLENLLPTAAGTSAP
jgi:hypothetical protein